MAENKVQLTKKDRLSVALRSTFLQGSWNYERMQNGGWCFAMIPAIKKLYTTKEDQIAALKRHLEFFNSHVNADALILGITAAIEETTDEDQKETVTGIKTGLMGPLAGLGDSILKFTWLPICGSIGAALALNGSILGPILMFLLYNSVNVASKYYGIHLGYKKGMDLIEGTGGNILQRLANMANVVGLMVIGALIASVVKVKIVSEISAGENVIAFQEMFDKVMPGLFSLLITFIVYKILKKTNGKHAPLLIVGIMVLSIILTMLGILG